MPSVALVPVTFAIMSTHRTDAASGNSNLLCKSWADLAFTICAIHLAAAISAVCCGIMVVERLVAVCRAASGNTKVRGRSIVTESAGLAFDYPAAKAAS